MDSSAGGPRRDQQDTLPAQTPPGSAAAVVAAAACSCCCRRAVAAGHCCRRTPPGQRALCRCPDRLHDGQPRPGSQPAHSHGQARTQTRGLARTQAGTR
eukprot:scaffold321834_cov18-Tisochrysis_lutea.AAC.1